jgi:hypothetical protein
MALSETVAAPGAKGKADVAQMDFREFDGLVPSVNHLSDFLGQPPSVSSVRAAVYNEYFHFAPVPSCPLRDL